MVRNFLALRGLSPRAGCSATHLTAAPLSALLTGRTSLEMEVQVRILGPIPLAPEAGGRVSSWVCPEWISWSPVNHLSLAGGLPPVAMHSNSKSSPAEATISCPREDSPVASPTVWMTMLLGFSARKQKDGTHDQTDS